MTRTTPNALEADYLSVTVTVKMTRTQRERYAVEYGMEDGKVPGDVKGQLQEAITEALASCYWLREFTTFSASEPS